MSEIRLKKGESVYKGLRRLKKKLLKEKTLEYARSKNYYEKPATKNYKNKRRAKYNQRLRSKAEQEYWG